MTCVRIVSAYNAHCHMKVCISCKYGTGITKYTIVVLSYLTNGSL